MLDGRPVPLAFTGAEAPLANLLASAESIGRDDFEVVWYIEFRNSMDAGTAWAVGILAPFIPVFAGFGRVPGCTDCRPRGVSRITRKCPVNGGASAAGRWSGSIWLQEL